MSRVAVTRVTVVAGIVGIVGIAGILGSMILIGCDEEEKKDHKDTPVSRQSSQSSESSGDGHSSGTSHTVLLEAGGSGAADIAYLLGQEQAQDFDAALPWNKKLSSDSSTPTVSMMVSAKSPGQITCRISIDGKVINQSTSEAGHVMVACKSD